MTLTEARTNLEIAIGLYGATSTGDDVSDAIDELVRAAKEEAFYEGYHDAFSVMGGRKKFKFNPYRKAGK